MLLQRYLFVLLMMIAGNCAFAQFLPVDDIFYRTSRQSILCPPEKVYLHTDRATYVGGDTIWVRAHVVDGVAHVPMKLSAYVYVVFQNPFLETISQIRMRADKDGAIYGYVPLPEDLPTGEYSLIAYTQYMQNFSSDYFFKKKVLVKNVLNSSIRLKSRTNGKFVDLVFENPVTGMECAVQSCIAKSSSGEIHVSRKDKMFSVRVFDSKEKTLLVQAGNYKEFISLDVKPDYDVSFLPEGGNLVPGVFNRVAFKSINHQGQGEDIIGTLRDESDSILLDFKSLNRGMGFFTFVPERGKHYVAVCENSRGQAKSFTLPIAKDIYTLQVNQIRDKVFVKVLFSDEIENDEKLLILAHQRGWPVKIGKWGSKTPGLVCSREDFIEGVVSFLLVNETGRIVSERMIFIQKENPLFATTKQETVSCEHYRKVKVKVNVSEKWWNGDCSVAVVDYNDVKPDSCVNILSSLLLSSDLRGYIETPSWYFEKDEYDSLLVRKRALDALMMTQGWRKYDLQEAWNGVYKEPAFLPERSQRISGNVTTRIMRKPVSKAKVQLMVPSLGVNEELKTKKDGTFVFEGFDAPDNTVYWVSAYTDKGKPNIVVELDSVLYPKLENILPPLRYGEDWKESLESMQQHFVKASMKIMHEKGIRHLFLDEVLVAAPKLQPKTEYEKILGAFTVREDDIRKSGAMEVNTLLVQKIAGLSLQDRRYVFRGAKSVCVILDGVMQNPLLEVKETQAAFELLQSMSPDAVMQIDFVKGPQVISIHPYAVAALIVTTKKGNEYSAVFKETNLKRIVPLGFQPPCEFYSPRYEYAKGRNVQDYRTTIYWQPRLEVKNGKAEFEFCTKDAFGNYSVIIEGVGDDGGLLRLEKRIE